MAYDAQGHKLTTYRGQTGYWGDEDESGEPFFIPAKAAASTAGPLSTAMQMVQALQAGGIDPSNATVAQLEAARQAVGAPAVSATSGGMAAPSNLVTVPAVPETGDGEAWQPGKAGYTYDASTLARGSDGRWYATTTDGNLQMIDDLSAWGGPQLQEGSNAQATKATVDQAFANQGGGSFFEDMGELVGGGLSAFKEAAPGIALVAGAGALGGAFPSLYGGIGGAGTVAGGAGETALAGGAAADTLGVNWAATPAIEFGNAGALPSLAATQAAVPVVNAVSGGAGINATLGGAAGGALANAAGTAAAAPSAAAPGITLPQAAAGASLAGTAATLGDSGGALPEPDYLGGLAADDPMIEAMANESYSGGTGNAALDAFIKSQGGSYDSISQAPSGSPLSDFAPSVPTDLAKLGLTTEQAATAAKTPGMIDKLLSGTATAADLAKLGLGAAAIGALASEDPDRTSTTKVEYPDWYNEASKSAIALADKYAALGPGSVAPLSANETAAIQMAKDSAGNWKPLLDKSTATLDASRTAFDEAGALAGTVPGYLDKASGQIDAAMPYFKQAGDLAATVPGFTKRAGEQVDAAMPYFTKAGSMADSVSGYLNRSGALADEAAGGIPSINLSSYMNPYLDNVLAPIARRNEIAKAAALNDIKAKAGMRGAFGGSRSTLLEGQTSEAADRNLNEAEANIRSGAFTTGLTAAQADLNRKLAASGQFGALAGTAGNTAGIYGNLGKGVADTANVFNNAGAVSVGGANALNATGRGVADTAGALTNMGTAATNAANAKTSIGRSLTDAAGGFRSNAGALSDLTGDDIARLTTTGGTERSVEQAKLNAPLTAIGGYANALRGNPGATTTSVAPEASKIGQATGALTALLGANKAGWI